MQGDVVRLGQQVFQVQEGHVHFVGHGFGDVGVVGDDVHAEGLCAPGDEAANIAKANDAQGFAVEFRAGEVGAFPLAGEEGGVGGGDVAADGEHEGHGVLGGSDGIGARGVHDDDAAGGGGFDVDVVYTNAGTTDDFEVDAGI